MDFYTGSGVMIIGRGGSGVGGQGCGECVFVLGGGSHFDPPPPGESTPSTKTNKTSFFVLHLM
jgi:hypothetical protein